MPTSREPDRIFPGTRICEIRSGSRDYPLATLGLASHTLFVLGATPAWCAY